MQWYVVILLLLILPFLASAKEDRSREVVTKRKSRRPASIPSSETSLGLPFGLSVQAALGAFGSTAAPPNASPKYTYSFGLGAELRYSFLALELGYVRGAAAAKMDSPITPLDAMMAQPGSVQNAEVSISDISAILWARKSFEVLSIPITPRVGLGYEVNASSSSMISTVSGDEVGHFKINQTLKNIMFHLGMEFPFLKTWRSSIDYGFSVVSSPTLETDISIPASPFTATLAPGETKTQQFRLAVAKTLSQAMDLGLNLTGRATTSSLGPTWKSLFGTDVLNPPQIFLHFALKYRL